MLAIVPSATLLGAARRLNMVGKPFVLEGATLKGRAIDLKKYQGKTVADLGKMMNKDPLEAAFDLIVQSHDNTGAVYFSMSEADVKLAMRQPWVSVNNDASGVNPEGPLRPVLTGTTLTAVALDGVAARSWRCAEPTPGDSRTRHVAAVSRRIIRIVPFPPAMGPCPT